jgi:hypothetical protein
LAVFRAVLFVRRQFCITGESQRPELDHLFALGTGALIAEAPHAYVFSEPLGEQPLGPVSILPATNSLADASRHVKQVRQVAEKFRKYDNATQMCLSAD